MKDFLSSVRFKILAALLIVLLGFMIMAVYTGGSAPLFAQLVSAITRPFQQVSANISYNASELISKYANAGHIYEENQELRAQINELRGQLVDYEKTKRENEQFRQIIGVMENRQDQVVEIASVIARDSMGQFYSFTIDKGSLEGIKYLDPVISPDGLVGYVIEVGMTYAKVATILDVTVDVGAYDSATRDIGIVSGTIELAEDGLCQLEYLPRDSKVAAGDIILTSGGSLFPRDLVIGTVRDVQPNSHGTSMVAIIEPAADVTGVKDVFVITYFEGQGEQ